MVRCPGQVHGGMSLRDNVIPHPVYEGARTCKYGMTIPPPLYQPFKRLTKVPCYRALTRPHGRSTTQVNQARTGPSRRIEVVERHNSRGTWSIYVALGECIDPISNHAFCFFTFHWPFIPTKHRCITNSFAHFDFPSYSG